MFQTIFVEKIKAHILYSVTFIFENRDVCEIKWKNMVESERPQMTLAYNTAHALWMLDNYGYRHTLILFNMYCFSMAAIVFANVPWCFVIRTLPVFFQFDSFVFCPQVLRRIAFYFVSSKRVTYMCVCVCVCVCVCLCLYISQMVGLNRLLWACLVNEPPLPCAYGKLSSEQKTYEVVGTSCS
jgi:hypothetical protein